MTLTRRIGQRVLIDGGKFYGAARIEKILQKNIDIRMESNNGRVRAYPGYLSDLADDAPVPTRAHVSVFELPTLHPGQVVTVKGQTGQYVVLADKLDKVNVAKLGGDNGRYLRAPRAWVELAEI